MPRSSLFFLRGSLLRLLPILPVLSGCVVCSVDHNIVANSLHAGCYVDSVSLGSPGLAGLVSSPYLWQVCFFLSSPLCWVNTHTPLFALRLVLNVILILPLAYISTVYFLFQPNSLQEVCTRLA